jgi:hypothetical protein
MKHETIQNEFSRKSKRYRTKYFEELGKLFGDATKTPTINQDELSHTDIPMVAGHYKIR